MTPASVMIWVAVIVAWKLALIFGPTGLKMNSQEGLDSILETGLLPWAQSVLCGDLVYVIVFPQLLLVLYFEPSNTYGSVVSFFVGLILRILCGDDLLGFPATISFGTLYGSNPEDHAPMPFRTFVMLISLLVHMGLSSATQWFFSRHPDRLSWDFFQCFHVHRIHGGIVQSSSRHMIAPESIGMEDYKATDTKPAYSNQGYT
eukprot:maker-scaffold763_size101323-snap-gene-0.14 protein:Tk04716 transcript:maker-scaffold763_size101323-snap-gene-0.14-mRNA-1 annotation:"cre-cho-1 protein"